MINISNCRNVDLNQHVSRADRCIAYFVLRRHLYIRLTTRKQACTFPVLLLLGIQHLVAISTFPMLVQAPYLGAKRFFTIGNNW